MKIALLSGGFPPDLDGIGDYTFHLAQELARQGHAVTVFTSSGPERTAPAEVRVIPCFRCDHRDGIKSLPAAFRSAYPLEEPDWFILQYNPFSFGKRGFCPYLPKALEGVCQGKARLAVMFHETMVPVWPWKFTVMRSWQFPIFRRICRLADVAFVSTTRWMPQIKKARADLPTHHLPVGSNIPLCTAGKAEARSRLSLDQEQTLIGVFGQAHPSRLFPWIGEAARAIAKTSPHAAILNIGPGGPLLREVSSGVEVLDAGVLSAEQTSLHFRALDVVLSPFSDGISTRRTSAITPIQHGIPLASTCSPETDRLLAEARLETLLLSKANTAGQFASDVSPWFARIRGNPPGAEAKMRDFYQRHFSWEAVTRRMNEALSSPSAS